MTPNVAFLGVHRVGRPSIRLWLPLVVLWLPVILLAPLALPLLFVACRAYEIPFVKTIAALWLLLRSLRGTDVHLTTEGNSVELRIL